MPYPDENPQQPMIFLLTQIVAIIERDESMDAGGKQALLTHALRVMEVMSPDSGIRVKTLSPSVFPGMKATAP